MKRTTPFLALGFFALLGGCASSSGILQLSGNTYMISKASGFGVMTTTSALRVSAIRQANEFATKQGKIAVARVAQWERTGSGFPMFVYQFILVDKNDPRANDAILEPVADTVIEDRRK